MSETKDTTLASSPHRILEFVHRLGFNLPDAFSGHSKYAADFRERVPHGCRIRSSSDAGYQ